MGQKISQLTDGVTAVGSDLLRVARSSGGGYIDRRLSIQDILDQTNQTIQNITITGGDTLRIKDFEDGVNTSGTGVARSLASIGYTNGTAATQFPLTAARWGSIDASTVDYDTAVIQEAFETLRNGSNKIRKLEAGFGYFTLAGNEIIVPSYKSTGNGGTYDPQQFIFDGCGSMFRMSGSQAYGFTMSIADQTEALGDCIDNRWTFGNLAMRGTGINTGIRLGATRSAFVHNINVVNFNVGIQVGFLLNALYQNVSTTSCDTIGFLVDKGWWTGAGYSTAGNQPYFLNCRFRTTDVDQYGAKVVGADSTVFERCTVEGTDGLYGIYIDNSSSSVSKNAIVRGLHSEIGNSNKYTNAIIGVKGSDPYTFVISEIYSQGAAGVVLVESESVNATNTVVIRNCKAVSTQFKLNQINSGGVTHWDIANTNLPGGPSTNADVIDTVNYPNIWATGTVPTLSRVKFSPALT